jgi:PAS domain-containing protein
MLWAGHPGWRADRGVRVSIEDGPDALSSRELALAAADVGSWELTVATGRICWDDVTARLHGLEPRSTEGTVTDLLARVHDADRSALDGAIATAVASVGTFESEVRVVAPDGGDRWIHTRGGAITGDDDSVARVVGLVMDATELRARAVTRERQLGQIAATLADSRTTSDVARTILESTRRALDTLFAGVALIDETGRFLEFEDQHALPDSTRTEWGRVPLNADVPVTVAARSGRRFFHESADELLAEFPNLRDTMALVGQGAFANVPLVSGGRPFGVLAVSWTRPRRFSESDRDFIVNVAVQCAQAIDRARAYERERSTARLLQQAMLPELSTAFGDVRCAGRYLAAETGIEVGGDWYDAFLLADGSIALAVGDVAGHGLDAAVTMSQLSTMLRAYAFAVSSPATVLDRLDAILSETGSEQFATCFFARFEPRTRVLTYANAGHPPPLVLGPSGQAAPLPTRPAPLLGAGGVHPEASARLEPGTSMLLYTDGLVERRDRPITDGIQSIVDMLGTVPARAIERVCDEAVGLAGHDREDDVCLLAVDFGGHRRRRRRRRRRVES